MKRVGKRTRESAGGAKGLRCRAVVEEQAARRAARRKCDATGSITNLRSQDSHRLASAVLCARHGVAQQGCTRMLWAGSHFALPSAAHSNLKPERADGRAAGKGLSVWGLDGSGQSR